jgi:hypothetical protein
MSAPGLNPQIEIALRMKGKSFRILGRELGIDPSYLHRVSNGAHASQDVLDKLGLERVVKITYRRKRQG